MVGISPASDPLSRVRNNHMHTREGLAPQSAYMYMYIYIIMYTETSIHISLLYVHVLTVKSFPTRS